MTKIGTATLAGEILEENRCFRRLIYVDPDSAIFGKNARRQDSVLFVDLCHRPAGITKPFRANDLGAHS